MKARWLFRFAGRRPTWNEAATVRLRGIALGIALDDRRGQPIDWDGALKALAEGADPNVRRDRDQRESVLHAAAMDNRLDVIDALMAAGADVDAASRDGRTALMMAIGLVKPKIPSVRALLRHGANVSIADCTGWAPLHLAAYLGHVDVTDLLVAAGADVNLMTENDEGWTPLAFTDTMLVAGKSATLTLINAGACLHRVDRRGRSLLACWDTSGQHRAIDALDAMLARTENIHARQAALASVAEDQRGRLLPRCVAAEAAPRILSGWSRAGGR